MSTFDIRTDTPHLLKSEALTMSLVFERTSATSGKISWNIPLPAAGCGAGTQAYCGIVITMDNVHVSNDQKPVDGKIYQFDPTADRELHSGDKLASALVVGAFYQDHETTSVEVTGLEPDLPYYVSGFPVDCEYRYYWDGIYAYSVNHTNLPSKDGTIGSQSVQVNTRGTPPGVECEDNTGLVPNEEYKFNIRLGIEPKPNRPLRPDECRKYAPDYDITIKGEDAETYCDLIDALNAQLAQLGVDDKLAEPPQTGKYVVLQNPTSVWRWDGYRHVSIQFIEQINDPSVVVDGQYWYNKEIATLYERVQGIWIERTYNEFAYDPLEPNCNSSAWIKAILGNPTEAYIWNGTTWCQLDFYNSPNNPLTNEVYCGYYWHDTANNFLYVIDTDTMEWNSVDVIQSNTDPFNLPAGFYWFNETTKKLNIRVNDQWVIVSGASVSKTTPSAPSDGKLWVDTVNYTLNRYDLATTTWVEVEDWVPFPSDPTLPTSCQLWWDLTTESLNIYDVVNSDWKPVNKLYSQDRDPLLINPINQGSIWYNPTTDEYTILDNDCFVDLVDIIISEDDPTQIPDGTIWKTGPEEFKILLSGVWIPLDVLLSANDPTTLPIDTVWWNGTALRIWNGLTWIQVGFATRKDLPSEGDKWFNTTNNTLYEWNGKTWVEGVPLAQVSLDCNKGLKFEHTGVIGSLSMVQLFDDNLFASLTGGFTFLPPVPGEDGFSNVPLYEQEGIGTDGSTDERNRLSSDIRIALGYPQMTVELTQDQLDLAIEMALSAYRERASYAYRRGFFFMQTNAETQTYLLTNKVQGMQRIVKVLGVTRLTSAFLSSAHGAGVYGQIMLQHLYNMGNFDILSYHLMANYVKELEIMFAGRITFNFNEQTRELTLYNRMPFKERLILIEASVERSEQELMSDRWSKEWLRRYATAKAKDMLSQIRGKFSTLPGASGNVTLNAAELRTQAEAEIEACINDLDYYVNDAPENLGFTTEFVFG